MIGERYAVSSRVGGGSAAPRVRQAARPAIAGRDRLADLLGGSVLVQLMLAMSLVALAALLYLAQASQASVLDVNISALQGENIQLNSQNATLHSLAVSLQSPQRIDAVATNQLHMTHPDISTAIWISPVMPQIPRLRPLNADTVAAQQRSQPLAWMQHALTVIKTSL